MNAYKCVAATITFEAEQAQNYLLQGDIEKGSDFADLWIEELASGKPVSDKVRTSGFF